MLGNKNKKLVSVYPGNATTYLHESNPYVQINQDDSSDNAVANALNQCEQQDGIDRIYIPDDLLEKATKLEKNNCAVRFICFCDIIMSGLYFFNGWIFGLVCMIVSTNGYLATIYYNKSLMVCYLIYQYMQVFVRFLNMIVLAFAPNEFGYNSTVSTRNNQEQSGYFLHLIILFVLFFFQTAIAGFITNYYKLLPTTLERQRIKSYRPS